MKRYRSQPRHRGVTRQPIGTSVIDAIERQLEREMKRWNVSRSFVVATVLAYHFNVNEQDDYRQLDEPRVVTFPRRGRARRSA